MGQALADSFPSEERRPLALLGFVLASLLFHGVGFGVVSIYTRPVEHKPVDKPIQMEIVEVEAPPPPPPPVEEKKPPIKVASSKMKAPEPVVDDAPPPPNEEPAPETPPEKPVLVVGMTMSSTSVGGNFAAPVGNTLYGKAADKAVAPEEVKPYSAPRYAPIYQVDSEPSVVSEIKIPYPPEARRASVEGSVVMSITVDIDGNVVGAKLVSGPGYGLNEAALQAIRKFKFRPAMKNGESVSTEFKYAYTFLLD